MIQTRNQYLQFMLIMLAAWGISWGARFVMEQAVLLYGLGKNYLFFSHGTVLMYLLCVFLVYRRWIAPLPVVGQLRNVGVPWLVGAMAVVYVGVFLLGKALALQALPMTQGVYGMVASFLMLNTIGLFGTPKELTVAQGAYFIMAALPIALAGYLSAIKQARVSAAGISLLSKRPGELGKAITSAALVETYAIFSLLITLLMVANFPA